MIKITVYPEDGVMEDKEIEGKLEEMQEIVGGYIEPVYLPGKVVLVDEEGLCKNKKRNSFLSSLCGQLIVGTGFVMDRKDWDAIA